jgi:hypothetical protein
MCCTSNHDNPSHSSLFHSNSPLTFSLTGGAGGRPSPVQILPPLQQGSFGYLNHLLNSLKLTLLPLFTLLSLFTLTHTSHSQVVQEADPPLSKYYRHISKGAWPFSSRDHGWPISDCTSEGFKAALGIAALGRTAVLSGPKVRVKSLVLHIRQHTTHFKFDVWDSKDKGTFLGQACMFVCTLEGFKAALGIAALGRTAVLSSPRVCWHVP